MSKIRVDLSDKVVIFAISFLSKEVKLKKSFLICFLFVFLGLSSCSTTSAMQDNGGGLETYNRAMFSFNNKVDKFVIRPVAKGYKKVTNKHIRTRVSNFFNNIGEPISAANHILQGKFSASGENLGRFVLNTTLGVVGLYDVASSLGLEKNKTGFDETMATWCMPDGPFVVLPFVGPSTPRAAFGFVADAYSSPAYWVAHESGDDDAMTIYYAASGLKYLNLMAENLSFLEGLEEGSVDYYEAVKSAYMQNRNKIARCGKKEDVTPSYDFDMGDMDDMDY